MKIPVIICVILGGFFAQAADLRVWTSRQGSTIEAQLSRVDGDFAVLVTPEPKEIKVKVEDLSLADRQHLVEYADQPDSIITEIELGVPEEDVRIDKKQFKKLDKQLVFDEDSELLFDLMESDHFLIATAGKARPNAVAEIAERLWHGMAFQHMNFRTDWGDQKLVIFLIEDEGLYAAMGKWYIGHLKKLGEEEAANKTSQLWDRVSGTSVSLPNDVQDNYNVFSRARVLRIRDSQSRSYRKVFGAFPTHTIASTLLAKQMGGQSDISPPGYFALLVGHAYYKEIQLAEKSETTMLSADDYEGDEIAETRGFQDGTSWAKTLRKLVKSGDVKLDVNQMLSLEGQGLTPEGLVTLYSFAYYMNSTPARVSALAEMVRRIESNKQIPASVEIAKIFGFDSVEALQEDWKEFVLSRDFK
ncbi:hypothetical protein [Roseibacillus persicicus]|uniref:hypothetical protein n=1 Tax=Roseibacillus persicicus TaxID=454148 RepID=UPI0028120EB4|nr:hypothetical protein [Roseibacillus persicicus]